MDSYELRTGFKDWYSFDLPIPLMSRGRLDLEAANLIDSWKFEEWKDRTEEDLTERIGCDIRDECFESAFDEGFTDGKSEGLEEGKVEGFKEGYANARDYYGGLRP